MTGSKTAYGERATLDGWFGRVPLNAPGTWYFALTINVPDERNPGVAPSLAVWTNYHRAAYANTPTNWPAAITDDTSPTDDHSWKYNANPIEFGTADVIGLGVPVVGFEIYTAAVGGARFAWGSLATTYTVKDGACPVFPRGFFVIDDD